MDKKVILISIDGMRSDAAQKCGNPFVKWLCENGSYTFDAQTVNPSVTLPCHMSMFHSVTPQRHGIVNNTFSMQVRPVSGLFEQLKMGGKHSAMYYGWEPLRDISRPASLLRSEYINAYSFEHTDAMLTDRALEYIKLASPDFVFLYMVETDEKGGHDNGWMSEMYLDYVKRAFDNAKRVIDACGEEYTVIITADHGGHDRTHGTTLKEDMTIPMFFVGDEFEKGKELSGVSILDLAPTISHIIGVQGAKEWEGKSLL